MMQLMFFKLDSNILTLILKTNSPLKEIHNFHIVTGLSPDAMHDIFEGLALYEIKLVNKS